MTAPIYIIWSLKYTIRNTISSIVEYPQRNYVSNSLSKKALKPDLIEKVVSKAVADLKTIRDRFDVIAFTGASGCLVAPIIANRLSCNVILVRKTADFQSSHSNYQIEGMLGGRYLIIDDCVESGRTIKTIVNFLGESQYPKNVYAGTYLYNSRATFGELSCCYEPLSEGFIGTMSRGISKKSLKSSCVPT